MSEESLSSSSLSTILHNIAEGGPAPACGSAAAIAAGLAAALVGKVARRSSSQLDDAQVIARTSDDLRKRALVLADEDAAAVTAMIASRSGVPKEAIAVPQRIGELADEVGCLASRLEAEGNQALVADAASAMELAKAARATIHAILTSNES